MLSGVVFCTFGCVDCYILFLSFIGVLLTLRLLFDSVSSKDSSRGQGDMLDVLSSNFSISSMGHTPCFVVLHLLYHLILFIHSLFQCVKAITDFID